MSIKSLLCKAYKLFDIEISILGSIDPKILDIQGRENEIGLQRNQIGEVTKRWGMGGILALVAMVFVYAGWTGDKELAEKVMIAGISGLGGFGAGVVVGKQTQ